LSLVGSWAAQGVPWAIGVTAGVVTAGALLSVGGTLFGLVWLVQSASTRWGRRTDDKIGPSTP
jgi:hypothetical protein